MLNLLTKQNQALNITIALNEVPEKFQKEMEIDCVSSEWKQMLEVAEKEVNQNYTIIYRDTDGTLKEAWHYLSELNMAYVKNKYKHQKKEILYLEPKTLAFGQRLSQITGGSKNGK